MNTETWNKHYPVGTDVFFRVDHCEECHSVTASRAWTRVDGTDVVKLQGVEGDFEFELSRLRPGTIKHDIKHRETHHHPFGQMEQMPLNELLDMMASHGVAKVASVFSNQDDRPVFAVVLLTGEHIQDYLDAFDRIDDEDAERQVTTEDFLDWSLGGRLKRARKILGHTQKSMADAVGSKLRSWQDYEANRKVPGSQVLAGLVDLSVNANWVLTGKGRSFNDVSPAAMIIPDDSEVIYRWRALDYSGYVYGSHPPTNLPERCCLKAFYGFPVEEASR